MAVAGIVAEYNPLHRGHLYQMEATRKALGQDTAILCVMSGNFVQRGEPAIVSKHARAEAAVRCGADLVIELPTPWATATAETFARGAVSLLHAAGVVDCLSFGSESGDLIPLQRIAQAVDSPDYPEILRLYRMMPGRPFASARQLAVADLTGPAVAQRLEHPNDILAVEYLRALNCLGSAIRPLAVRRQGAEHDGKPVGNVASASAVRRMIRAGENAGNYLPEAMAEILRRETEAGRAPAGMGQVERAVLSRLRTMGEEEFALYDQGGEGVGNRLFRAVHGAATLEEVLALAKTRRYPMARLRRMVLHAWLDIRPGQTPALPPYLRVLAIGRRGRELLRRMKETALLPVVIRPGQTRKLSGPTAALFALEARCTDLYTLAWPRPVAPGEEYIRGPVVLPLQEGDQAKED